MTPRGRKKQWLDEVAMLWESDDCLLFPFPLDPRGYGNFQDVTRKTFTAHVYICEQAHGPCPYPEWEAAHSCGRRNCVNKRHLRWASRADNESDKLIHGTHNRGERQGQSKLTSVEVLAIRAAINNGEVQRQIASRFGISEQSVSGIKSRKIWSWL